MKILICAHGVVGHQIIRKLVEKHNVDIKDMLVFSYDLQENSLLFSYLKGIGVKYTTDSICKNDGLEMALSFSADIIASAYGREIIPIEVLNTATIGTFNLHPSLLPDYRGCFSSSWAIINGESITGITFHEMVKNADKGKILFQKNIPIYPSDTAFTLYNRIVAKFLIEFDSFFEKFVTGGLEPRDMSEGGSFYRREIPFAGVIDHSWPEDKIALFIRAMFFPPYKAALAKFNEIEIEIDTFEQYITLRDKYTK